MKNLKIFTRNIEDAALNQINELLEQDAFKDAKVRIMPDVHAGKGCVIGFTGDLGDKVIPNIVGVDIGCGMLCVELGKVDIDLEKLDKVIRDNVPSGRNVHELPIQSSNLYLDELYCKRMLNNKDKWLERSLGTLGGGNHFIEVDVDDDGNKYLIIHTGSRNLGKQVAEIYQNKAIEYCSYDKEMKDEKNKIIKEYKEQGREKDIIIFSSVDNKIKSFTDQPNRLNVVVSRAIKKFILVVNNSAITNDNGNIQDLIKYIKYQDGKVVNSKLRSCFDLLYKEYYKERKKISKITGIISEDLFYETLSSLLKKNDITGFDIITHVPLDEIIADLPTLTAEEMKYKKNNNTHVDFLVLDRATHEYRLAIEVDGGYHNPFNPQNSRQVHNDELKNQIFEKAGLPLIRCKTDGIPDEKRIINYLK